MQGWGWDLCLPVPLSGGSGKRRLLVLGFFTSTILPRSFLNNDVAYFLSWILLLSHLQIQRGYLLNVPDYSSRPSCHPDVLEGKTSESL